MDDLRRTPPFSPPLAVRERGNRISVRQQPNQDGGWGTLRQPKPLVLPVMGSAAVHTRLGYEAEPSTEVWAFTTRSELRLQAIRRSEDPYANCVAVALVNGDNRRVASLVASAGGVGEPAVVPAGHYKLVVSLGVAEKVQVEVELNTSPANTLAAAAGATCRGWAQLLQRPLLVAAPRPSKRGKGQGHGKPARLAVRPLLVGLAAVVAGGRGALLAAGAQGLAAVAAGGRGLLQALQPQPLAGAAMAMAGGEGRLAKVKVVDDPDRPWRARKRGRTLELNAAYFRLNDVAIARQQLEEAGL